jgi:hypothetical protein
MRTLLLVADGLLPCDFAECDSRPVNRSSVPKLTRVYLEKIAAVVSNVFRQETLPAPAPEVVADEVQQAEFCLNVRRVVRSMQDYEPAFAQLLSYDEVAAMTYAQLLSTKNTQLRRIVNGLLHSESSIEKSPDGTTLPAA